MAKPIDTLIRDNAWIHAGLGLIGNVLFVAGSIMFLPALKAWKTVAVWLFIAGSFLMLVGALGNIVAGFYKRK